MDPARVRRLWHLLAPVSAATTHASGRPPDRNGPEDGRSTVPKSGAPAHHFVSRWQVVPRYHPPMYADGLSFLDEERDAWRPFEALLELTDEQLERPLDGAHGWTGRDLMAHLGVWIEWWLRIARELAVSPNSPAFAELEAIGSEWEAQGDALNARYQAEWAALSMAELRERLATFPGELRGYLTVVPETRWLKDSRHLKSLLGNTTEHYAEHEAELRAVLAASGH